MSAERLRDALKREGILCEVQAEGRLAVILAASRAAEWARPALRSMMVALAADAGFTHIALEISDDPVGAALPRA